MGGRAFDLPSAPRIYHHPAALSVVAGLAVGFPREPRATPPDTEGGYFLWAEDDHLELRHGMEPRGVWVPVAELLRREQQGGELLRACGAGQRPRLLDAMAGWGVDGLVLARRGCTVTLVERQPLMVALQQDLVRRSGLSGVRCHWGDGFDELVRPDTYDVVYLDPMFPVRRKRALPGKRLQWLAELAEPDGRTLEAWLDAARCCAVDRVVLKRRRRDPLLDRAPDWQILGRTVRYDVYRAADRERPGLAGEG